MSVGCGGILDPAGPFTSLGLMGHETERAGPRSGAKLWAAAQIRETATFRLVNFLTGFWPGNAFQISTRRGPGQRFAKWERSPAPLKRAASGLIWLGEVKTAMWLLRSMVNVSTLGFSLSRQYRDHDMNPSSA